MTVAKRRGGKPLKRETGTLPELTTIVVFCEGKRSEPDYVAALRRLPEVRWNTSLQIEIVPQPGVPLTLVQRAVKRARDPEVNQCWCLFDVEWPQNHPHLAEAMRTAAQREGVHVAVSNPCFELWLILHHQDQTAGLTTAEAVAASEALDGRRGKRLDGSVYMEPMRRKQAIAYAKRLHAIHQSSGTRFPHDNPGSGMYLFLEAIGACPPED
ncbi:MAG: RloB family protein [Propionibacteriaceae bacterium]|nr:RloB family protein [Propionibacteriaceae bacterium]